jgi:hypothetical protein
MRGTEKLIKSIEHLARSLAQRYDLDYDLTLAAIRQVLTKMRNLKEMNTLEKLTWQKKAGIISETQYREAVEQLTSEETLRNQIKETLTNLLTEKKKKKSKSKPEEEIDVDIDVDAESTEETPEGGEDMMAAEPVEPTVGGSAQDVQKELMDALEAAKSIGDVKLQRQISNALTYFTRQQVAGSEAEASSANAPL